MNIEFVAAEKLREAERLLGKGDGDSLRSAALSLLVNRGVTKTASSENCAPVLNKILQKLNDDPYACLGIPSKADGKEIKRAYRQLALKYHPDKNANKTSVLFAAIQGAYVLLNDESKRKTYDLRKERREQQTDRLRKRREDNHKPTTKRTPSTNSFHVPPQSTADAKQRDFNRKFYNEYRNAQHKPPPPPGPAPGEHALPPPPKPVGLRMTSKSDTTVTLEWRGGHNDQCAASKAFELQWRVRAESGRPNKWETSQQLILRSTCRKRNLRPGNCYEFRVRAASISGWSPHSDSLVVVTLSEPVAGAATDDSQRSPADRSNGKTNNNKGVELPKVKPTTETKTEPWQCVVCKRSNAAITTKCSVCGTRKDYGWQNVNSTGTNNKTTSSNSNKEATETRRRSTGADRSSTRAQPEKDDDDYGIDGADPLGGTWTFSEKDVPERYNAYDDIDQWMDEPTSPVRKDAVTTHWLNPAVTCLHNVRQEPIKNSPIVGHLVADTEIQILAETGNWIKCKFHRPYKAQTTGAVGGGEGWCLKYDDEHQYIIKDSYAYPSRRNSDDPEDEVIYELRDEDNRLYYFNTYTGVSMWEPPEWVDEIDPTSGAVYYTHSKTGETQWERPFDFVPIVREELYSTPQAKFIKSILSPKRSNHNLAGAM
ncbi:hypothetical protein CTAYLR_003877 [Chrysophaeum taylorii]|uniref:Uncharacterized protein n=1 Tax=Chrysophaeum taylorii TaxID=2483200 RepID=A0AAD7XSU6_9STRA|nr:hypothetical protein CTAYLR_003877 [Chrysophaeum taylorii]